MSQKAVPVYTQSQRAGIEELFPDSAERILDIGGASGAFVQRAKQVLNAEQAYLADYSESALAEASERVDGTIHIDLNTRGALREQLAKHPPFDLVFCLCVLEHLLDPWAVVQEIHEALPMGGRIIISVPNTQHIRFLARAMSGRWHYDDTGLFDRTHLRFFSQRSAERLATCSGLKLVAQTSRIIHPKLALLDRITGGIFRRFFALQFEFAAIKVGEPTTDTGFFGANVAGA